MSWSKGNKILLGLLALGLVGAFVAYKIVYKPHPVIEQQTAAFTGSADVFATDVAAHPDKWLNDIVEITGTITDTDQEGLMLNGSIYCPFK